MKVKIEMDSALEETEVIIRCSRLDESMFIYRIPLWSRVIADRVFPYVKAKRLTTCL